MSEQFYKISCVNQDDECNYMTPYSEKLDLEGKINPRTGQKFTKSDIYKIRQKYDQMCLKKSGKTYAHDGKDLGCCDPKDHRLGQIPVHPKLRHQYPRVRRVIDKKTNTLVGMDVCYDSKCNDKSWEVPNQYLLCKLGSNKLLPTTISKVYRTAGLDPDCSKQNCSPNQKVGLDNILGEVNNFDTSYVPDSKLVSYIENDDLTMVKQFFDDQMVWNTQNNKWMSPNFEKVLTHNDEGNMVLHEVANNNAYRILDYLLANKIDIDLPNLKGERPIHLAVKSNNANMSYALINSGANLFLKTVRGETPLAYAVKYAGIDVGNILINNGASVNEKDKKNNNLLHLLFLSIPERKDRLNKAKTQEEIEKILKNIKEMAKLLIDTGVELNEPNNDGLTAAQLGDKIEKDLFQVKEGFSSMSLAEQLRKPKHSKEEKLNLTVRSINTAIRDNLTKEQQKLYEDYRSDTLAGSPVNKINSGCVGGDASGHEVNKEECDAVGGRWLPYYENDFNTHDWAMYKNETTKIKIDQIPNKSTSIDEILDDDLYYPKDGKPTPSPTPITLPTTQPPTPSPIEIETPTPSPTEIVSSWMEISSQTVINVSVSLVILFAIVLSVYIYLKYYRQRN